MSSKHAKLDVCSNCGYKFNDADNYCPECGQKNHDLKIPLKHLIEEIVESTLHLDSKTFRTIKYLIIKPGFLSSEFNEGRRNSYVPPFRLYIFISFIFFFLLNMPSANHNSTEKETTSVQGQEINFTLKDSAISTKTLRGLTIAQTDSLMKSMKIEPTLMNKWAVYQLHKVANSSAKEFTHSLIKNISYMMFVLMPIFALMIMLFNRKQIKYYLQGLILSVHFHGFIFLLFTVLLIIAKIFSLEIIFLVGFLGAPVYMMMMFKIYFKQRMAITFFKTSLISVLYFISLVILLLLTIIVSMAMV